MKDEGYRARMKDDIQRMKKITKPNINAGENEANALILEFQNGFHIKNDARMLLFFRENQDSMKWLEEFNRSARINQYIDEYKLQVVSGYLQGTAGQ
ncbi:hypothetical protein Glove_117g247 [Diversispora epigaea]|uniref:Uncharacterized protein n=1 Tax=Diversispora epigaea TaxID=1348612 RepID=A0A397J070_9GLOM|nr:hypothetical protein Glove_117g247 [Diversispora epigaea]